MLKKCVTLLSGLLKRKYGTKMNILIEKIDWKITNKIWMKHLWPDRVSKINKMSSMLYLGGFDLDIYNKYIPSFFGAYIDGVIVGVNSGHGCNQTYRSRGLFVFQEYQNKGIARMLMNDLFVQAQNEGFTTVWSYPRFESLGFYEKLGFCKKSEWIKTPPDTTINCYANIKLK